MAHHNDEHHIIPFGTYIKVFSTLIGLTIVTVAASRLDFGAMNAVVAFGIATIKALLVLAYFMHLKYDSKMNRAIIASAFFFLIVMYLFIYLDDATRAVVESTL